MPIVISRHLLTLALAGLALACRPEDVATGLSEPLGPSPAFGISDGANGPTPHFFLLPPLARQPVTTGAFDATLAPTVEICAIRPPACGDIIASFTKEGGTAGEVVTVDPEGELYQVAWKTRDFALSDDVDYRILVRVGTVQLGHADIDVVRGATEFRILNTNEFIPLDEDLTLPIRFRAEDGIPGRIAASPAEVRLEVGDRRQLGALVYDLHDRLLSEDFPLRWTTSNPDLVEVDQGGVVLGKAPGRATVAVSVGALGAPVLISVLEAVSRRLAFVSNRTGAFHIYTMNGLGGDLLQLTTGFSPAWSPNGAKIAFERNSQIWVMNADGSGTTNLSNGNFDRRDWDPRWSPDGTKIAFMRDYFDQNQQEIFVMNADGTGKKNLSKDRGKQDDSPSWSPDGIRIAFFKDRLLHAVNADGSGPPELLASIMSANSRPVWSPNGSQIAFTSIEDVFVIAADGSGFANLTNSPEQERRPFWSPDGKLYFFRDVPGTSGSEIWVMNGDGTGQQLVLSTGAAGHHTFDVTSDGLRLAYVQGQGTAFSTWEVFKSNSDGTGQTNLTNTVGRDIQPAWRP